MVLLMVLGEGGRLRAVVVSSITLRSSREASRSRRGFSTAQRLRLEGRLPLARISPAMASVSRDDGSRLRFGCGEGEQQKGGGGGGGVNVRPPHDAQGGDGPSLTTPSDSFGHAL